MRRSPRTATRKREHSRRFARSALVGSPERLIAGMWNHSRLMEEQATARGVAWPVLTGPELGDLAAYLGTLARPAPSR